MAMSLRVVVPPHPLIAHWLTLLRDGGTPAPLYATALMELGRWLSYEAVRDWLPQQAVTVTTPLAPSEGTVVDGAVPLLALPLLPAGLGLWEGARTVLPAAAVAPLLSAGAGDAGPTPCGALPNRIGARVGVLVFVAELAAPEPLLALLDQLRDLQVAGPRLRLITALACAPALSALGQAHPDLTVYSAGIDAQLDEQGRILPGLGDVHQRFTGLDATGCLG